MCTPHLESKFQSDKQTDLFMSFHICVPNFIPNLIPNSTGQKYDNLLGVRSKLLFSIVYRLVFSLTNSNIGYVHVFAGSQVRRPISYLQITTIFLFKFTSLSRLFPSHRDEPIGRWGEKIVPQKTT